MEENYCNVVNGVSSKTTENDEEKSKATDDNIAKNIDEGYTKGPSPESRKQRISMSREEQDLCRNMIKKLKSKRYYQNNHPFLFPFHPLDTPGVSKNSFYILICFCSLCGELFVVLFILSFFFF